MTALEEIASRKLELARRAAQKGLASFTRAMWPIIEPTTPYKHNWHIDATCEFLEAVTTFRIKKGVIMVPPRHMKSISVSVMWQPWVWLREPSRRFVFSSYASSLSVQDAVKARNIIKSEKYNQWFNPKWTLKDDQDTKARFENTDTGYRISTSVDGVGTGLGGDYIVGDDLLKVSDAMSDIAREEAREYWLKTMALRGNDPEKSARVLVMQRIAEDDPAGAWLAEQKDVEYLRLPAEYDKKLLSFCPSIDFKDPRTEDGELLWPEHYNKEKIKELKESLGSRHASAQLQQDPKPAAGGMFKRHWWKFYREAPAFQDVVQFWDCAETANAGSDFSVCATWGRSADGYYMLDLFRQKLEVPDLERAIETNYAKWAPFGCTTVVIEKKSGGSAALQYLSRSSTVPGIPYVPTLSKEVRADAATPTVEAGKCHLPMSAPYIEDFIKEHETFPLGKNDDQVDTTSMMRDYFASRAIGNPRIRRL